MSDIDFSGLKPKKRKPTRKEAARYKRWVKYLSDSRLSEDEIHSRAKAFTKRGRDVEKS